MQEQDKILSLPKSMVERALWARQCFIDHPGDSQVDDNLLVWCWNPDDGLWYSILGNYSATSPQEKRDKQLALEVLERNVIERLEKKWSDHYKQIAYESEIRARVLERDCFKCQKCGKTGDTSFHIHHVLKRSEEGSDHIDNLITVCPRCHPKADRNLYDPEWK